MRIKYKQVAVDRYRSACASSGTRATTPCPLSSLVTRYFVFSHIGRPPAAREDVCDQRSCVCRPSAQSRRSAMISEERVVEQICFRMSRHRCRAEAERWCVDELVPWRRLCLQAQSGTRTRQLSRVEVESWCCAVVRPRVQELSSKSVGLFEPCIVGGETRRGVPVHSEHPKQVE